MSGSVSPLPWTGSKGCIYTTIDAFMPPHKTYVEACMGSAEVFLRKKPVEREIINDYNGDLVKFFRVLQQNEKLAYLLGRLYLSFNSEELFRINKAMLADVPNILDDLTETSITVEKAEWSDIEKAVAFFENQIFSFSSTGKTFAIAKKDMTKRFGRLVTACSRLRNAVIMHRDYKDCISYAAGKDTFILLDPPYKGKEKEMEYKTEFTILLPEKLTAALDIDEDTLFETYFDDGKIKVRVIDESEFEDELSNCDLTDNDKECAECPNYCHSCGRCLFES